MTSLPAAKKSRSYPTAFSGKPLTGKPVNTTDIFFWRPGCNFFIYPTYEFLLLNPLQFTSKMQKMNIHTFPPTTMVSNYRNIQLGMLMTDY